MPADPDAVPWAPQATGGAEVPPVDSGVIGTHDPLSAISVALILSGAIAFSVVVALG